MNEIHPHKAYLAQRFNVRMVSASKEELLILEKYGCWLQALQNGSIKPETLMQKKFVEFCKQKNRQPSDKWQSAWNQYLIDLERRNASYRAEMKRREKPLLQRKYRIPNGYGGSYQGGIFVLIGSCLAILAIPLYFLAYIALWIVKYFN